jgi:photosystem II stability/assembly factor-like uncharacterized protein
MFAITGVFGQPWVKHVKKAGEKDDPVTFYEIQEAFEHYWSRQDMKKSSSGKERKVPGWKQFRRWEHYWQYRIDPSTGLFPQTTPYLELKKYQQDHQKAISSDPSSWRNLGIDTSYGGYAGIGRLNALAFHPDNDQVIWVGSPSGGLWKTTDGGENWSIQNEGTAVLGVSDIVIPEDYSTSQTLYVATGDRDGGSLWTLGGGQSNDNNSIGVLKSTDGGDTWQRSLSFDVSQKQLVTRILMHPGDDQVLYAATSNGVYKTTDAGANWNKVAPNSFIDMEFKPGDPAVMYGSTQKYGRNGIYRSTDGGQNWSLVQEAEGLRIELSVTPDDTSRVYAVAANTSGGLQGIYRSNNSGQSFQDMNIQKNLLGYYGDGSGTGGQGSYDLTIQADPNHADTLFVGGINTWRSVDGGNTWDCVNAWISSDQYNSRTIPEVHADKHAMAFQNGTSVFFEGNDGGIYRTDDYGTSWEDLTNGMVISQLYRLGNSQTDSTVIIAGLQDNGTKVRFQQDWYDVIGGDGMECIVDYQDNSIQYGTLYYGDIYRTTNLWNEAQNIKPADTLKGAWATPYVINPKNPSTLYAGYDDLWKSTDRGDSWTMITDMKTNSKLRSIDVAPSDTQVIYMGDLQNLWRTYDGGDNWKDVTGSLPVGQGLITGIEIDADSSNRVWVSVGNYNSHGVYQTLDSGRTWTNISAGLPDVPVMDVVHYKINQDSTELYAATDIGVFRKAGPNHWKVFSNNLPNVVVSELDIYYDLQDPTKNRLRAATYGRGLWETNLPEVDEYIAPAVSFDSEVFADSVALSWQSNIYGDSLMLVGSDSRIEATPRKGESYQAGESLDGGGTVLYLGSDRSGFTHSGLDALSNYFYKLWSVNEKRYSRFRELKASTTCRMPGEQASALTFSSVGTNHITLSWSRGDGDAVLVTASSQAIENDPQDGRSYQADNTYGEGQSLASSVYTVYSGSGDTVRVKGLEKDKRYYFNLYEFNVADSCYLKPGTGGNTKTLLSSRVSSLEEAGFRIYPNPATNRLVVEAPSHTKKFSCKLIDFTGKTLLVKTPSRNKRIAMSVEQYTPGLYIIQVKSAAGTWHKKVLLK